jgi:hypothetical protein
MALAVPGTVVSQTDFYNLDKDRPLRVEDAYTTKRYAFELKGSPLTLSQDRDRTVRYRPELELKYGLLPGLDVSAGIKGGADRRTMGGTRRVDTELELSSLLNLTVETRWLPALGFRATGHLPLEGDHDTTVELRGIATRTLFGPVRAHLNGAWVLGDDPDEEWWAGVALDYVLPFQHTLLMAEGYVADGVRIAEDGTRTTSTRTHTAVGFRYQASPTLALDGGIGRDWTGATGPDWRITLGLTYEFAVRALMPGARR